MKVFKNVLCIRADNMGDLIMTSPAMRALKETLHCRITVLTSSAGKIIAPFISEIDEVITADLPWIKTDAPVSITAFEALVKTLRQKQFDLAVIFTVYSQNPLPAAMLAFQCGIAETLSYCRENPYHLISLWQKEEEPYKFIRHQVRRDLDLVASIGAHTTRENLELVTRPEDQENYQNKLCHKGVDVSEPYIILHPGVSEEKRRYSFALWVEAGRTISKKTGQQILITGSKGERVLAENLARETGAVSMAGELDIGEMISLIKDARALVSVNSGPVHMAAAVQTPVVVLYALTNPQHTPWQVPSVVLPFSVDVRLRSRNQVVEYVNDIMSKDSVPLPTATEIMDALEGLLSGKYAGREAILQL